MTVILRVVVELKGGAERSVSVLCRKSSVEGCVLGLLFRMCNRLYQTSSGDIGETAADRARF